MIVCSDLTCSVFSQAVRTIDGTGRNISRSVLIKLVPKLKCVKIVLGKNHKCVAIERDHAT